MDYSTARTYAKNLPNSLEKTLKTCWPKLGLKSGWAKTKNTRSQWFYPSNPIESLPIFQIEMTTVLSYHKEFPNGFMILIQMGTAKWNTYES